jgi:hypothetical protein
LLKFKNHSLFYLIKRAFFKLEKARVKVDNSFFIPTIKSS